MMIDNFQWTVIGAGPAGIAAVGQLLDAKIPPKNIAWIDPDFKVGDFGTAWKKVTSNTPVKSFIKFYNEFESFDFNQRPEPFMIEHMKDDSTCPLMLATQPLTWITGRLKSKVTSITGFATTLGRHFNGWSIKLSCDQSLTTQKVILALGGESLTLPYPNLITIPLKTAVNPDLIIEAVEPDDIIAVFGSYQSARTVAENLAKTKAKKIIHFYRSERSFEENVASLDFSDQTECYPITPSNLLTHIPLCNKAIYAVGFTRRTINIEGLAQDFGYDAQTGIVAPGIYGLGMAFPEILPYTMGRLAYKVSAIWPFTKHLKKIFPIWLHELC